MCEYNGGTKSQYNVHMAESWMDLNKVVESKKYYLNTAMLKIVITPEATLNDSFKQGRKTKVLAIIRF